MSPTTTQRDPGDAKMMHNLGSLRLRHLDSNQIILVPAPTIDPNDPLNWSKSYRWYIAVLVSIAIFLCNFLAAGPSIVIAEVTAAFFGPPATNENFASDISKTAYFFTSTSLAQGMGTLFWMPLILKYGRRPIYVTSFVTYTACSVWSGSSTTYGSELASRIVLGFAAGAAEVLAPLTISDIFFLHERGTVMGIYTCALSAGVGGGVIVSGLISINYDWRMIYWVSTALIGASTILVILTFPETMYRRDKGATPSDTQIDPSTKEIDSKVSYEHRDNTDTEKASTTVDVVPKRRGYVTSLRLYSGTYTQESFWTLFIRPVAFLILPPVLWATLVMSCTIGFLVAITSNVAPAYSLAYGFEPWQTGLCFCAALIGSFIAIFCGGNLGDWVADIQTRRNDGIREPEMRLPAIGISVIAAPLALVLYGVGINNHLHWICPTIGLALISFSIVQATNISLLYTIDSYRPAAGELVVAQMAFKSAFGFLLSFYTNPWVEKSGYLGAYGAMAGITSVLLLLVIPFYFFGQTIRNETWKWSLVRKFVHWDADREIGE